MSVEVGVDSVSVEVGGLIVTCMHVTVCESARLCVLCDCMGWLD